MTITGGSSLSEEDIERVVCPVPSLLAIIPVSEVVSCTHTHTHTHECAPISIDSRPTSPICRFPRDGQKKELACEGGDASARGGEGSVLYTPSSSTKSS